MKISGYCSVNNRKGLNQCLCIKTLLAMAPLIYTFSILCCVNITSSLNLSYLNIVLQSTDEIVDKVLQSADGETTCEDFISLVQTWLTKIQVC